MNRVVITGMGIYSTIGKNIEEVKDSLYNGNSGIGFEQIRKEMGFRSGLTGIIERPNLKGELKRRQRVGLAEEGEFAYIATIEALKQAKIDQDFLDKFDVGILYGNDSSARAVIESYDILPTSPPEYGKNDEHRYFSMYLLRSLNGSSNLLF